MHKTSILQMIDAATFVNKWALKVFANSSKGVSHERLRIVYPSTYRKRL